MQVLRLRSLGFGKCWDCLLYVWGSIKYNACFSAAFDSLSMRRRTLLVNFMFRPAAATTTVHRVDDVDTIDSGSRGARGRGGGVVHQMYV